MNAGDMINNRLPTAQPPTRLIHFMTWPPRRLTGRKVAPARLVIASAAQIRLQKCADKSKFDAGRAEYSPMAMHRGLQR